MSEDPPLIVLGLQVHDDDGERTGSMKDTMRNILRTSEFVVNLLDEDLLIDMVGCATDFPTGVSETAAVRLSRFNRTTSRRRGSRDPPSHWNAEPNRS